MLKLLFNWQLGLTPKFVQIWIKYTLRKLKSPKIALNKELNLGIVLSRSIISEWVPFYASPFTPTSYSCLLSWHLSVCQLLLLVLLSSYMHADIHASIVLRIGIKIMFGSKWIRLPNTLSQRISMLCPIFYYHLNRSPKVSWHKTQLTSITCKPYRNIDMLLLKYNFY